MAENRLFTLFGFTSAKVSKSLKRFKFIAEEFFEGIALSKQLFNDSRSHDIILTELLVRPLSVIIWKKERKGKMLVFGHIGITLGAAALLANTLPSSRFSKTTGNEATESSSRSSQVAPTLSNLPSYKPSWFASLGNCIDIRLLLIGSLLPDIIDKPIGLLLLRETLSNGRIFCHTLLFLILITIAGLYLYRSRGRTHLFAVSFGVLTHLIFDQMWRAPRTLLWPVYGLTFDRMDVSDWMPNILHALFTDPATYLPELVGAVILVWFAVTLMLQRKALHFLKSGRVQKFSQNKVSLLLILILFQAIAQH